ncbi:hypothetical protein M426DRAFT_9386 [Hypoxylon sp. CI-4A]|nr:hypothetical protein M426DRAFT_9386 [Hypoxylon sp. CI-4A]
MIPELPEEILHEIFLYLQPPTYTIRWEDEDRNSRQMTLVAIARCSKAFCRIVRPILYENIYTSTFDNHFFRTICEDPSLGLLVHNFQNERIYVDPVKLSIPPEIREKAVVSAQSRLALPDPLRQQLIYGLDSESSNDDVDDALLLVLLPNLRSLNMEWYNDERAVSTETFEVISQAYETSETSPSTPRHFSKLQSLKIRDGGYFDMYLPLVFLRIPNLAKFTYNQLNEEVIEKWAPQYVPIPEVLSIQHLDVDFPISFAGPILTTISRSPSLRSLKLFLNSDFLGSSIDDDELFFLSNFGRVMRAVGDTAPQLETLDLRVEHRGFTFDNSNRCIGSLQELWNLRELRVSLDDLIGRERTKDLRRGLINLSGLDAQLPDSLEALVINVYIDGWSPTPYILDQIELLLSSSSLTKLRKMTVGLCNLASYDNKDVHYSKDADDAEWTMPNAVDLFSPDD